MRSEKINYHLHAERATPLIVAAGNRSTLQGDKRKIGLLLALSHGLVLLLLHIGLVALLEMVNPQSVFPEALFLSLSLLLWAAFSSFIRFYDLADARYALGKSALIATSLWLLQQIILTGHGVTNMWTMLLPVPILTTWAIASAVSSHYYSQGFHHKDTTCFYFQVEIWLKRTFDVLLALGGCLALLPLMAVMAMLIRLESDGPAIYSQTRIGQGKKPFLMFKFRSMFINANTPIVRCRQTLFKSRNDNRITRIGRIIRKLSIDELPQLWNVLNGTMSLVGPRPPLDREYREMNAYHCRKFEALPGLTGLWQITGRIENKRDFNAVAACDVTYIENWCLIEDIGILLKTIPVVLFQKGAC